MEGSMRVTRAANKQLQLQQQTQQKQQKQLKKEKQQQPKETPSPPRTRRRAIKRELDEDPAAGLQPDEEPQPTQNVATASVKAEQQQQQQQQALVQPSVGSTILLKHETKDNQLTDYERKRLENIQRNLEFMKSIGVSTAKIAARTAASVLQRPTATTKPAGGTGGGTASTTSRRRATAAAAAAAFPTRQSLRIRGIEAQKQEVSGDKRTANDAALARTLQEAELKRGRFDANLDAQALNMSSESNRSLLDSIITANADASDDEEEALAVDSTGIDVVDYQLAESDVLKAVPERIYSLAFHPRKDKVVLACGDKSGRLALWSADSEANDVAMYRPHSLPVSSMGFFDAHHNTNKLFSSSFDGSIREFDLQAGKFTELFATEADVGITLLTRNACTGAFVVSCDNGFVHTVDIRAAAGIHQVSSYYLHEKKVNTVHQHPTSPYCLATASLDRTVCLWDLRKIKASHSPTSGGYLVKMPHHRSVNCAYFSPHGEHLVTVCQDDHLYLYDTTTTTHQDVDNVAPTLKIPHCNKTGRWLTKFHASWDPKKSSQFVVGCMQQPRRLQLFDATRKHPIQELRSDLFNSVHSIKCVSSVSRVVGWW